MPDESDIEFAHAMTFDSSDVQAGREEPLQGRRMGNLTVLGAHLRYVVKRLGDPLIHMPGRFSSRTACNYSVTDYDEVYADDDTIVTCVRCAVFMFEQLGRRVEGDGNDDGV